MINSSNLCFWISKGRQTLLMRAKKFHFHWYCHPCCCAHGKVLKPNILNVLLSDRADLKKCLVWGRAHTVNKMSCSPRVFFLKYCIETVLLAKGLGEKHWTLLFSVKCFKHCSVVFTQYVPVLLLSLSACWITSRWCSSTSRFTF